EVLTYAKAISLPVNNNHPIVRGLDYYTRTVFEVTTTALGAQNAVAAGGRYDDLVTTMGGPTTPAIGFAAGFERLVLLLEEDRFLLKQHHTIYVACAGQNRLKEGLIVAEEMRACGWCVEFHAQGGALKNQLKKADRLGAAMALILGDQEVDTGTVIVKDMVSGQQESVPRAGLVDRIRCMRGTL
ncbi:MAG: ATP phosphoribosyltransferase regulatory subunit, partial [Magnetococcales bacterium]|nr:ATP phosphoribosyltransferase regulatory subunit [Magnetococcales bacterium]